jgi:hypothetical protein
MVGAAAAGETMTMRNRIRICVLVMALALSNMVTPAQAWPAGEHGDRPAVSWWAAMVEALTTLLGLAGADNPPPATPQGDNSCMIDPWGGCRS